MRAIVTVVGPDRVGIIAEVCGLLAKLNINIVDISQTVMEDFFTMMMLTDTSRANTDFDGIADALAQKGEEMHLSIRVQREDIFDAMHKI
jgi:ACT domain-containing protein